MIDGNIKTRGARGGFDECANQGGAFVVGGGDLEVAHARVGFSEERVGGQADFGGTGEEGLNAAVDGAVLWVGADDSDDLVALGEKVVGGEPAVSSLLGSTKSPGYVLERRVINHTFGRLRSLARQAGEGSMP